MTSGCIFHCHRGDLYPGFVCLGFFSTLLLISLKEACPQIGSSGSSFLDTPLSGVGEVRHLFSLALMDGGQCGSSLFSSEIN